MGNLKITVCYGRKFKAKGVTLKQKGTRMAEDGEV